VEEEEEEEEEILYVCARDLRPLTRSILRNEPPGPGPRTNQNHVSPYRVWLFSDLGCPQLLRTIPVHPVLCTKVQRISRSPDQDQDLHCPVRSIPFVTSRLRCRGLATASPTSSRLEYGEASQWAWEAGRQGGREARKPSLPLRGRAGGTVEGTKRKE
jgi:hypothetical protein